MPLIKCVECGKLFSNKATCCPECGCPAEVVTKELMDKQGNNSFDGTHKYRKPIVWLLLVVVATITAAVVLMCSFNTKDNLNKIFESIIDCQTMEDVRKVMGDPDFEYTSTGSLAYYDIYFQGKKGELHIFSFFGGNSIGGARFEYYHGSNDPTHDDIQKAMEFRSKTIEYYTELYGEPAEETIGCSWDLDDGKRLEVTWSPDTQVEIILYW